MNKKFFALTMAAVMTAACLSGCGSASAPASGSAASSGTSGADAGSASAIKIGGIGPVTGSAAVYGLATKNGAQVAVDEINAMGGLQFELNFQDDEADAEKGVNAYHKLQDWGMQILYGCTTTGSCAAVAAESYAERYFQITPSASSTTVTDGKDNVFQVCFTDPGQGAAAAKYVADNALGEKIAVIYNNADPYSTGIYTAFAAEAQAQGLNIVSTTTFPDDTTTDFTVQLNDAKSAGADLIFMPIYYTPASLILSQAKSMNYQPGFFGCDGMDGILSMEGFDASLAEGLMLMTPFNADASDDATASFVKAYQAAYGETPNQFAADGYDAIYAIYQACQSAGVTADMSHEDVCEAMVAQFTGDGFSIDGLTGAGMAWAADGSVSKAPVAIRIEGGKYVNM
jgi:branched-chain amino acid transport system substrate-binding protein